MAETTPSNDGGVVVVLFLAAGTISLAMIATVVLYEYATRKKSGGHHNARILRLASGWSNLGNAAIHVLLALYMLANSANPSEYWTKERELGGIEGPVGLAAVNLLAGICATRNIGMKFPAGWNCFVAVAGTLMPVVWLRFLEGGLATWPYPIVFVWFCIFFFELTAVSCSLGHLAIVGVATSKGKAE